MNSISQMKRYFLLLIVGFLTIPGYTQAIDSLLLGRDIFDLLSTSGVYGNSITIQQPTSLINAIQDQIIQNRSKKIQGYRVRIFSSNAQTARASALAAKEEFESLFPWVSAHLNFGNLDFRVTVGNFRTKSEAMRFHKELIAMPQYRASVVVRELIEFPSL